MIALADAPLGTLPYYARPKDKEHDYVWRGVEYPRVTHVLGTIGKHHLYNWYAKMAAVECAEIVAKIENGILSQEDGFAQIKDWQTRMTKPIRDRDHKGRIGSIVHHYLYERALGLDLRNRQVWTMNTIENLQLLKRSEEDFDNDYAMTLATLSSFYIDGAEDWLAKFNPDWEAIGQEAVVINEEYGYAGTCDGIARFSRKTWPKDQTWNFEQDEVRLLVDFKTSNAIQDTFFWQVEAYRHGQFIGLMEDGSQHEVLTENGVPLTDGSMILHITPDTGVATITAKPNPEIFEAFVSLIHVYNSLELKPSTQKVKKIVSSRAKTEKREGPRPCRF